MPDSAGSSLVRIDSFHRRPKLELERHCNFSPAVFKQFLETHFVRSTFIAIKKQLYNNSHRDSVSI